MSLIDPQILYLVKWIDNQSRGYGSAPKDLRSGYRIDWAQVLTNVWEETPWPDWLEVNCISCSARLDSFDKGDADCQHCGGTGRWSPKRADEESEEVSP